MGPRRPRNLGMVVGRTSIILSDGTEHRRRRSLVQPGFARRRLDSWIPLVVAETDRMIDETVASSTGAVDVDLYQLVARPGSAHCRAGPVRLGSRFESRRDRRAARARDELREPAAHAAAPAPVPIWIT